LAALQMRSRHAQRGDQHGDAAQQENRARQSEESPQKDQSVLVEDQDDHPNGEQQRASDLAHVKGPRNVWHIIQEDIRQRRIALHVRNPLMHDNHR